MLTFKIRLSFLLLHRRGLYGLPCVSEVRNPPANSGDGVPTLGQEAPREEGMAIYPSILAWQMPWTEEPGRLQSVGSQSRARLTKQEVFTDYGEAPYQICDLQIFSFILWVVFSLNIL